MTTKAETRMTNLFDQAVQTFGDALKAGVKMQEEITRWWSDVMEQGPAQEWQKRSRAIVSETIPAAQKNAEEWMRVFEQNYRRSMDLFKKAMDTDQPTGVAELQSKTQELWEASMEVIKDNAQAAAQANVKMMETFAEILKKNFNGEATN
jgi:hypothetical protein